MDGVAKVEINSPKLFWISGVLFAQPLTPERIDELIKFLRQNNIDTVVNLSDYPITDRIIQIYKHAGVSTILRYPLDDKYFTKQEYPFLKNVMEGLYKRMGKRILVNCTAGVNRSATLIVYSILKDSYLSADSVIKILRDSNLKWRNSQTLINPTFVDFLKQN